MTTTNLITSDAMTTLELTEAFDVTYLPREIEHLLARTTSTFHQAILKNYLRHALLEISGYWDQILVPALTIDDPFYRVAEAGDMHVFIGHESVNGFYRQVAETRTNVMAARALNMVVGDFGVVTEAVWNHMTPGKVLAGKVPGVDPTAVYLMSHNIIQSFAYTHDAKLIGERVYDDPGSYSYTKLHPSEVITPEIARQQLAPYLERAIILHEADTWDASKFIAA
jgi:hypothetical protein